MGAVTTKVSPWMGTEMEEDAGGRKVAHLSRQDELLPLPPPRPATRAMGDREWITMFALLSHRSRIERMQASLSKYLRHLCYARGRAPKLILLL